MRPAIQDVWNKISHLFRPHPATMRQSMWEGWHLFRVVRSVAGPLDIPMCNCCKKLAVSGWHRCTLSFPPLSLSLSLSLSPLLSLCLPPSSLSPDKLERSERERERGREDRGSKKGCMPSFTSNCYKRDQVQPSSQRYSLAQRSETRLASLQGMGHTATILCGIQKCTLAKHERD